jgi:hypothetical protein
MSYVFCAVIWGKVVGKTCGLAVLFAYVTAAAVFAASADALHAAV